MSDFDVGKYFNVVPPVVESESGVRGVLEKIWQKLEVVGVGALSLVAAVHDGIIKGGSSTEHSRGEDGKPSKYRYD